MKSTVNDLDIIVVDIDQTSVQTIYLDHPTIVYIVVV